MTMTGHKTRSVFERYNILSPGDLQDAASKIDAAGDRCDHNSDLSRTGSALSGDCGRRSDRASFLGKYQKVRVGSIPTPGTRCKSLPTTEEQARWLIVHDGA
jgi:hypothetical protein